MEIAGKNRGLIVDFSMEDQRAIYKRKEKHERWKKASKEEKEQTDAQKVKKNLEYGDVKKMSRGQRQRLKRREKQNDHEKDDKPAKEK